MTTTYIPEIRGDTIRTSITSTLNGVDYELELMNYKFEPKPIPLLVCWDMGKLLYNTETKEESPISKLMRYKEDCERRYRSSIAEFMFQMGKW